MATIASEMTVVMQTMVKPVYENANVDNYYDLTALTPKVPSSGNVDRTLQLITESILYIRNPASYGYNVTLDDAALLEFYQDIDAKLAALITALQAVKSPIASKVALLDQS